MIYLQLAIGFILLIAGGEGLVRGSVAIARSLGVSSLLIGLTLVGFGTSMPELVTSVQAAIVGSPGIAVGNVIGSNIANILLILGVAAAISPVACHPTAFYRDGTMLAIATVACAIAAFTGVLGRPAGVLFLVMLVAYIVFTYLKERHTPDAAAAMHEEEAAVAAAPAPMALWLNLALAVGGIALTVLGARLLVDSAITLASAAGISETTIGLTVVAIGTSLPELVTSLVAAYRRETDVAFGNVIGSNIYNILGILGVTAVVHPVSVPPEILTLDLWVMLGVTALLIAFTITGWRLSRGEGAIFLAGYAAYIAVLVAGGGA